MLKWAKSQYFSTKIPNFKLHTVYSAWQFTEFSIIYVFLNALCVEMQSRLSLLFSNDCFFCKVNELLIWDYYVNTFAYRFAHGIQSILGGLRQNCQFE